MIRVEHIAKSFGGVKVMADFTVHFPENQITAILGPSGCGKTTLLNILAGLKPADKGIVSTEANVSYLFQEPRLLPWLTIKGNIALVLQGKMAPDLIRERVTEYLKATGLMDYADYYPAQLSGGLRQRAAMARAFSYPAPLLLMDEPFKSLDVKAQFQLRNDFLELWLRRPRTVVLVTHDVKEAILLGDKIVILSDKPVRVVTELTIHQPQAKRAADEELLRLEKELIRMILAQPDANH
jgi:NitT/TauT family transport system ATP-binding protein